MSDSGLIQLDPHRIEDIWIWFLDSEPRNHGILQVGKSIGEDGTVRFKKRIKTTDLFGLKYPDTKSISSQDMDYARHTFHFYEDRGASTADLHLTGLSYSHWRFCESESRFRPGGKVYVMFLARKTFFSIQAYVPRQYEGGVFW